MCSSVQYAGILWREERRSDVQYVERSGANLRSSKETDASTAKEAGSLS
jgi:hypothetical protein